MEYLNKLKPYKEPIKPYFVDQLISFLLIGGVVAAGIIGWVVVILKLFGAE